MCSHNKAIHNNRAIPSRIIRNRDMGSNRAIHPKVEGIKIIRNRGMANSKVIPSKDMVNSKDIPNKDIPNSKTISNRAMDNHLPGMLRPKKRRP